MSLGVGVNVTGLLRLIRNVMGAQRTSPLWLRASELVLVRIQNRESTYLDLMGGLDMSFEVFGCVPPARLIAKSAST